MKRCSACHQTKPIDDFNKCGATHYQSHCREYSNEKVREWSKANRPKRRERARLERLKVRDFIRETKDKTPCADCGIQYRYWVMQFDHLKEKDFGIAARGNKSLSRIKREMSQREIVCANCHADRTFRRRQVP